MTAPTPLFRLLGKFFTPPAHDDSLAPGESSAADGGVEERVVGNDGEEAEVARLFDLAIRRPHKSERAAGFSQRVLGTESVSSCGSSQLLVDRDRDAGIASVVGPAGQTSLRRRRQQQRQGQRSSRRLPRSAIIPSSHAAANDDDDDLSHSGTVVSARSLGGGSFDVKAADLAENDGGAVVSVQLAPIARGSLWPPSRFDGPEVEYCSSRRLEAEAVRRSAEVPSSERRRSRMRPLSLLGWNGGGSARSLVSSLTVNGCHQDDEGAEDKNARDSDSHRTSMVSNETGGADGSKDIDGRFDGHDVVKDALPLSKFRARMRSLVPSPRRRPSAILEEDAEDRSQGKGRGVIGKPTTWPVEAEVADTDGVAVCRSGTMRADKRRATATSPLSPLSGVTNAPVDGVTPADCTQLLQKRHAVTSPINVIRSEKGLERSLRRELMADDFDEYFDEICPPTLCVRMDYNDKDGGEGQYRKEDRDGHFWDTSMRGVKISFEDVDVPSPAGDSSPDSGSKRLAEQTKQAWFDKKYDVKNRMKDNENIAVADLCGVHGFPNGLARVCHRATTHKLPLRIWIVDNSGSMATGDGRRFLDGSKKHNTTSGKTRSAAGRVSQMVNCTRWEELRDAVVFHANLAASLRAPTIFRLLNDPNVALRDDCRLDGGNVDELTVHPQVVGVCARRAEAASHLASGLSSIFDGPDKENNRIPRNMAQFEWKGDLDENEVDRIGWEGVWELDADTAADSDLEGVENVLFETEPRYTTPLAQHIWALHDQIKGVLFSLAPGQRVAIIIATDGLPNDPESFLDAMRQMQKLPIYLIVRLCTNDEASMHFWNCLDLDVDIPIEILDDFEAEAAAAFTMNPWCNYCMPLQRLREWGFRSPLLEKLREQPLTYDELRDYCALIFGVRSSHLPHPKEDWATFYYDIMALNAREKRQWNPLNKRSKGWIDLKQMAKTYGGKMELIRKKDVKHMLKEEEKVQKERERRLER